MCGIAGIIRFDGRQTEHHEIAGMIGAMKYRGPDDEGILIDNNVALGHVRLSIIDLSTAGHQPMSSPDDKYHVVFNGEIYNYIELKKELEPDFAFMTKTDTEVLLCSYLKWGEKCLDRLNGMFAFAIYDKVVNKVFLARDRFGIKPLYYYHNNCMLAFASDIPPILTTFEERPVQDNLTIYEFMAFNRVAHSERTFFKDIKRLKPSHSITISGKTVEIKRWYNLKKNIADLEKFDEEDFVESLKTSIGLQLRSDVPVGACLSGGIDSSTIVSMILKFFGRKELHSFSAVYGDGKYGDESAFIQLYNRLLQNMHYTHPDADSIYSDFSAYVDAMIEPVPGTSAYAEFKVMKLARNFCTVVLNGQGADEVLGGYLYFFGFYFKELLLQLRISKLVSEIVGYKKRQTDNEGIMSFFYFLLPGYLKNVNFHLKSSYINKDFSNSNKNNSVIAKNLYSSNTLRESFINHFEYKFEHHLVWGDRSSMWFSLESRFPFLDHTLVEKVLTLDADQILQKGVSKKILRKSMVHIIPEKILNRYDKVGYATPEKDWLYDHRIKKMASDLVLSNHFINSGFTDKAKSERMLDEHYLHNRNHTRDIWKLMHLSLWYEKFI